MKLQQIVEELNLEVKTGSSKLDQEVTGGYMGDLLSDVMGNSKEGELWITIQRHQNIVAVASLKELSGIILANNREPEEETLKKAEEEGVVIMVTELGAFEIAGRLYNLLKS
ncbi:MAG: serine kinase [Proteobacteria bacterium]|nr:serine kinase [Pseudomonadota bacterium]